MTEVIACREVMEFDVVAVGAGPAGLPAAIRLKQLLSRRHVRGSSDAVPPTRPNQGDRAPCRNPSHS
jgi:hypothetical protein